MKNECFPRMNGGNVALMGILVRLFAAIPIEGLNLGVRHITHIAVIHKIAEQ